MKGFLKGLGKLALLAAIGLVMAPPPLQAEGRSQEWLRVRFMKPTFFQGVLLKGDYLIVHDEDEMANEKPCLFVYRASTGTAGAPVASLHGRVVARASSGSARIATLRVSEGVLWTLRDIQWPGSTSAHQVP